MGGVSQMVSAECAGLIWMCMAAALTVRHPIAYAYARDIARLWTGSEENYPYCAIFAAFVASQAVLAVMTVSTALGIGFPESAIIVAGMAWYYAFRRGAAKPK